MSPSNFCLCYPADTQALSAQCCNNKTEISSKDSPSFVRKPKVRIHKSNKIISQHELPDSILYNFKFETNSLRLMFRYLYLQ